MEVLEELHRYRYLDDKDEDDDIKKKMIKYMFRKTINKFQDNDKIENRKMESHVLIDVLETGFLNYIVYSHLVDLGDKANNQAKKFEDYMAYIDPNQKIEIKCE